MKRTHKADSVPRGDQALLYWYPSVPAVHFDIALQALVLLGFAPYFNLFRTVSWPNAKIFSQIIKPPQFVVGIITLNFGE